jgi:paraquat-inducible protein B
MPEALTTPGSPAAHARHRVSVIWVIPLIAALAAGWLGWHSLASRGPLITISFASVEGLEAGKTKIKHNDVELGTVESLTPTADLQRVVATARLSKYAEGHLAAGTRFWIVRPRFSVEGISGLSTLVSGAYIELDPGQGAQTTSFTGLEEPPVISADAPGITYTLHAKRLGSIGQGAPIYYRGIKVGQVLGTDLSDADGSVTLRIFIRAPHDRLVHDGTRFWNASGISATAGADGFKIQSESLWALLAGGIDFDVPAGGEAGAVAERDAPFTLYDDAAAADDALYTRKVSFLVHFVGGAQNLRPGAEVRMQGMRIGQVADVHIEYDIATDRVSVPVVIDLEADRVKLLHDTGPPEGFEQRAYDVLARFVSRGLRARLQSGNLITGQKIVSLDFVSDAPPASLATGGEYPEIPSVASDDIDAVIAAAKQLLVSLEGTAGTLNGILASPDIARSLRSLDGTLANLRQVTGDLRSAGVGPLVAKLRTAADSADSALRQAGTTLALAGNTFDGNGRGGGDLPGAIRELQAAARSIRTFADYLEGHPESLLRGRTDAAKR